MTRRLWRSCFALVLFALGCDLISKPAPPNGISVIYDGVEFASDDYGVVYSIANFSHAHTPENVELIFPDGVAIDPLLVTQEFCRSHGSGVDVNHDDGKGNYDLFVKCGQFESLQGSFTNNRAEELALCSHPPYGKSTISIKIRGNQITIPVQGDELKRILGEPSSKRQYPSGPARI